VSIIILKYHMN